jgi:predicted GNAT superfamily acetyltransferase
MSKSLIAQFYEEREGKKTVEYEFGFFTWKIEDGFLYVPELWIKPEERGKGLGQRLGNDILKLAEKLEVDAVLGSVNPKVPTDSYSLKCYLEFGFKMLSIGENELH